MSEKHLSAYGVTVLAEDRGKYGDGVRVAQRLDLESISVGDILFADETWYKADEKNIASLKEASDRGAVILTSDGASVFTEKGVFGSVAYSKDQELCGYYRDAKNNTAYCYSIGGADSPTASERMLEWASAIDEAEPTDSATPLRTVSYHREVKCGNAGWLTINATYDMAACNYGSYDYWVVSYSMEAVPNSGFSTTMMRVYDDFNQGTFPDGQLLAHGPNTIGGPTTTSADVSLGFGGLPVPAGWSYGIPDVIVRNNSSQATEVFSITHDIAPGSLTATNAYTCNPGALIKCDHGDSDRAYCPTDTYTIEYSHPAYSFWFKTFWGHRTYATSVYPMLYPDR